MEPLIQVGVPALVSLFVIGGGYWANSKLGISTGQKALVETLQGEVAAYRLKVERLETDFIACKTRLELVEAMVEEFTHPKPTTRRRRTTQ